MRQKKKVYLGLGAVLLIIIVGLFTLNRGFSVEVTQVKQGDIASTVKDTGYVQPSSNYDLFAAQMARVTQVPVSTGQSVKEGQTLVILENLELALQISEIRAQLSQAAAGVATAHSTLERAQLELKDASANRDRLEQLLEQGAAAMVDFEKAQLLEETARRIYQEQQSSLNGLLSREAGLRQSLATLELKEQQLVIKSPVTGIVLDLPAKVEQVVNPGTLLAAVAVPDNLEIKSDLLSDDLGQVKVGQKVTITAPVLGQQKLQGEVREIYPRAHEKTSALGVVQRRVPVIIAVKDTGSLKPGYEVQVAIETAYHQAVPLVPLESVRTLKTGEKQVMVVSEGIVRHRTVKTGISDGENVEVLEGLFSGELIIRNGNEDLPEKTKIKGN